MISLVQTLHVGNALRLFIEPPAGAVIWRVYRKASDTLTGMDMHIDPMEDVPPDRTFVIPLLNRGQRHYRLHTDLTSCGLILQLSMLRKISHEKAMNSALGCVLFIAETRRS